MKRQLRDEPRAISSEHVGDNSGIKARAARRESATQLQGTCARDSLFERPFFTQSTGAGCEAGGADATACVDRDTAATNSLKLENK